MAARPTYAELAAVLAARLDRYPTDGGLPELSVTDEPGPDGRLVPDHLVAKVRRALEAPIDELVARDVITSGDVLATVLPQLTAQAMAANLEDGELAALYAQTYAAFRRRRSLLLLDLEHQVRLGELPWLRALEPLRAHRPGAVVAARHTLTQTVLVALTAFPQAILPNTLVRELGALAEQAGLSLPLVEEVAADIFAGTFTAKWRTAAEITSRTLAGTRYARYYSLPDAAAWATRAESRFRRFGTRTAEDFAAVCESRAAEARAGDSGSHTPANATILEQAQIVTTHNLAALVDGLGLLPHLQDPAPGLATAALDWLVHHLSPRVDDWHAAHQTVKNAAYAWRQALFFLSFCPEESRRSALEHLREQAVRTGVAPGSPPRSTASPTCSTVAASPSPAPSPAVLAAGSSAGPPAPTGTWPTGGAADGSVRFGEFRQPVERGTQLVRCGRAGAHEALLVGEVRPVVGVGHAGAAVVEGNQVPPPEVPRRFVVRFGRQPRDAPRLFELDDVVRAHPTGGEEHGEHLAGAADAARVLGFGEVVVAVPAGLVRGIRDELEDPGRGGGDDAVCGHDGREHGVGHATD